MDSEVLSARPGMTVFADTLKISYSLRCLREILMSLVSKV